MPKSVTLVPVFWWYDIALTMLMNSWKRVDTWTFCWTRCDELWTTMWYRYSIPPLMCHHLVPLYLAVSLFSWCWLLTEFMTATCFHQSKKYANNPLHNYRSMNPFIAVSVKHKMRLIAGTGTGISNMTKTYLDQKKKKSNKVKIKF